jgi:RNA polymerase sigma factor (sigma-70 family)
MPRGKNGAGSNPTKNASIDEEPGELTSRDLKAFIAGCARGDRDVRTEFQALYGSLIYTFPMRIFHLSEEEAGDFYLYVFEKERIFRRIQSFEGRNAMQFETYLSYYVLKDLFLEWVRTAEQVETVSLDMPIGGSDTDGERLVTVQDVLPTADPAPDTILAESREVQEVERVLHQLEAEKRLIVKLLALGTVELEPDDIRLIAHMASRSLRETLDLIEETRASLAAKAIKAGDKRHTLHTVAYWIRTYQRQIMVLEEKIHIGRLQGETHIVDKLTRDKVELERKLAWRYRQQKRLREELQKFDVRPSYKDIAKILNVPLGTTCSRIARVREELGRKLAAARRVRM